MRTTAIPGRTQLFSMYMLRQPGHVGRVLVTAHEAYARDLLAIAAEQAVQQGLVDGFADIFRQVLAMATRAMARTPGEVERQRHLSGYFLEYDIVGCYFHR